MRFLSNFGWKIICALIIFGISKIPTHCLKKALVMWPLSASGLFFIDCVRQLSGLPQVVRGDCGTENIHIAAVEQFSGSRRNHGDSMAWEKSFLYGKSVANQRIEALLGFLRTSITDWWMRFFKDLTEQGHFDNSSVIHVQCWRFCFMGLIIIIIIIISLLNPFGSV